MRAGSDIDAMVSAVFSASSIRLASGTIRDTRPARSASAASIMRPLRQRSIAFALPTAEHEPPRLRLAARGGGARGPADARNDAELDLGLTEFGVVGRNDDIAM